MKLTCKCGATLEIVDEVVASPYIMDKFIDTHVACLQPEVHNHQHMNLDEAFWLNTFAGAAMQGLMAEAGWDQKVLGHGPQCAKIAAISIMQAKTLLEEVKKHG